MSIEEINQQDQEAIQLLEERLEQLNRYLADEKEQVTITKKGILDMTRDLDLHQQDVEAREEQIRNINKQIEFLKM